MNDTPQEPAPDTSGPARPESASEKQPPSRADRVEHRVELDTFTGPLDLLLYLIRREEVDIYDIPIARITEEYLKYLEMMQELDLNVAGEFVVMAATLLDIKARMMAPAPVAEEEEEEAEDPRLELVRQLMEYRRFKEAALELTERARARAERFSRPGEPPPETESPLGVPRGMSLWVLLDAFTRLLEQTGARGPMRVVVDQVPQELFQARLEARASRAGKLRFSDVFEGGRDRGFLIGMFLALLELVRLRVLRVEQEGLFGEIWLMYVPPNERGDVVESVAVSDHPARGYADAASTGPEEDRQEESDAEIDEVMPELPEPPENPSSTAPDTVQGRSLSADEPSGGAG